MASLLERPCLQEMLFLVEMAYLLDRLFLLERPCLQEMFFLFEIASLVERLLRLEKPPRNPFLPRNVVPASS